jgi:phosphodiesterase/alkaline phosphatase D-like protein
LCCSIDMEFNLWRYSMRTGMFKRFLAVCLSLAMVLGLLPGMTRSVKALTIPNAQIGVEVHFTASDFFDEATLNNSGVTGFTFIGFTKPTATLSGLTGQVGFLSHSYIVEEYYGHETGEDLYQYRDYYFIAYNEGTYEFTFMVDDGEVGNALPDQQVIIVVSSSNSAPSDITLSSSSIKAGSTGTGATVGNLSTTDTDVSDSHTYTLVSGTGDTNNNDFQISGSSLQTSKTLAAGNYSIRMRTTDSGSGNLTFDKEFTIIVYTAPTVTTNAAGSISASGVTLNGTVNANNANTYVTFNYGTSISYDKTVTADQNPATGTGNTSVSKAITGLMPNTTYHFRASGVNSADTVNGSDNTFTTSKAAPAATTNAASGISSTGATISGTVNASNESTTVTFDYGTTTGYGSSVTAAQSPVTGTSNTSVSYGLTGLTPNTTYHYRVAATNPTGTTIGLDQTFTTLVEFPTVTTGSASGIASTGATVAGTVNANNAGTTVTFEYGLDTSYGSSVTALQSPVNGTGNTEVSAVLYGLLPNTSYHFRALGVNTAGTTNGSDATFTTAKAAPVAITDDTSLPDTLSATLYGMVNANNDDTTVTFEYGLTSSYGNSVSATPGSVSGTGGKIVSCDLSGLTPNTTYHYRVVAVNSAGRTEGSDETFTTLAEYSTVITGSADAITFFGATLNGTVNANNADTAVTFQYGLTTSYGSSVSAVPGTATGMDNTGVSAALTGLLPNTAYHFRTVGVNAAGTTNGSDATFTTGKAAPSATTDAADGISSTGATLKGTVNASNDDTTVTFEYGPTASYGTQVTAGPSSFTGSSNTPVSYMLTGLTPNATYHYRVVAVNPAGRTNGQDQTFTTLVKAASVGTVSADSITSSGALLTGAVNANNASTTVTFEYGLTTSYGSTVTADESPVAGMSFTLVSKAVTGLLPNTLYHFRAVGVNTADTAYGYDVTFTTGKAAPNATTNVASSVSSTAATLNGTVNASNENTMISFEYGLSTSYGTTATAVPSIATGSNNTLVSYGLTGVSPNTMYHFRVVAANPTGTTNGLDQTFTTSAVVPTVTTGSADSITSSGAVLSGTVNANNADTTVTIQYGLTTSYGFTVATSPYTATGTGNTSVSAALTGLLPNTAYHFRAVGQNSAGTTNGLDATFTTGKEAPSALTNAASNIVPTAATLNGTVNAMNDSTAVTFEYGLTEAYGSSETAAESPVTGIGDTPVSCSITGLTPNTTYHYRVVAVNSVDTVYGSDQTFTTPLKPAVVLAADTADNDVDHPLEITFTPDTAFEAGITAITYGGAPLAAPADYAVSSGRITLIPAGGNTALHAPGTANLVISAVGYNDSTVSQTITAGAAAAMEITVQPVPGVNSGDTFATQPVITFKDQYGNVCGDGPSASSTVIAVPKPGIPGAGSWDIGGANMVSASNGIAAFSNLICYLTAPGPGAISFLPGPGIAGVPEAESEPFTIPLRAAVALTADTSDNSVDNKLELDFGSAPYFEESVTGITYNGTALTEGTDYELYKDSITLNPAGGNPALTTPATATLTVVAEGFRDSSVTQTITAGEVAGFTMNVEPLPGQSSGDVFATQPVVMLKDQYGNTCADGASAAAEVTASAAAGTGTWDIGGTVLKSAVNGIVTFDDLTCTQLQYGTGVMNYASGMAAGTSAAFDLPLRSAVALTADTSDNSVDHEIDIDYDPTPGFAGAISSITFGGVALTEGTDYEVYKGSIVLKPVGGNPALQKPATAQLVIVASGFRDSSISQTITAGEATSIEAIIQPVPGAKSGDAFATQPKVVLKDQYGNTCLGGPSASAEVTASAAAGTGKWTIGGTVSRAAVNGIAAFDGLTVTQLDPGTGTVRFTAGAASGASLAFDLPLKSLVILYPAVSGNSVDNAIEIVFPANADFEQKITYVKFGGTLLTPDTDYKVTSGKITLKPAGGNAVLRTPGTANITVSAAGYRESTVSQTITASAAASLAVTAQPVPGKVSGDTFATQPRVTLYDQYGNVCLDGPSSSALVTVSAAADTGMWTIGGETSRLAVKGVAAFGGLTSVNVTPGMGKMNFTCGAITVSSAPFTIPERNASISASSARFDKYAESGNNKSITVTLTLNGNTLDAVRNGSAALALNTDYTVSGNTAIIKKEYLAKQPKGTVKLTFDFSQGTDSVLSITVSDSTPSASFGETPPVNVIVNGEGQDAGSVSTTEQDGKTETTVTVDNGKLQQILDAKGNNASVVIPVTTGSSVSSVVMNGQMMSALQSSQATLQVQTTTSTYTLPSDGLDLDEVARQLGENVPRDDVKVNITISEPPAETVQVVEDVASEGNFAIMVPAVEFKVECSYGDQTVEVKKFNAYVERTIAIPDGVDPYKITTAVVVRPDKTTYHVPTKITVIDGKYYAVINSLTNSTYTVIWHPVAYEDMEDHWAKEAVNDMGSRMIVTGVDEKNYAPDKPITRADFVADVVRALGLNPGEGENPYADVLDTDWYCAYVKTAVAYGLLTGGGTAPFAANETVSREEAMTMIKRAMEIAEMEITLNEDEVQALLQAYGDGASVSDMGKESVAACLKAEVTFDLTGGNLLPEAPVKRAEAAVILRLLLQKAELI